MTERRKLRIAFVIDALYTPAGGTERQLLLLLEGLDRERFEPEVFCLHSADETVIPAPTTVLDVHVTKSLALLTGIRRFAGMLERGRFDIVQTHLRDANIVASLAARQARTPILIPTRRGLPYWGTQAGLLFLRWLNRGATWFIANSLATRDRQAGLEGIDPARFDVIYNGLHPSRLVTLTEEEKAELRKSLEIPLDAPLVGIVANLRPVKGLEDFFAAAAMTAREFPDAHFVIVGRGGVEEPDYHREAASYGMGERLRFLGARPDVPQLLQVFDVGVLASHSESFSNSVLEYVAAGLPVVVTDVGGVREIVEDGKEGFIIPPHAPEEMAKRLGTLLAQPGGARAWRTGRGVDDRFLPETMVAGHERLYERLAGQHLR